MEPTYTMLAADGNQYGPVSAQQMREWIRDGRVAGDTQIWRSDRPDWTAAANLPELGLGTGAPSPAGPVRVNVTTAATMAAPAEVDPALAAQIKNGAGWFYWIAAFSIINTVLTLTGATWGFAIGLGITSLISAIGESAGGGASSGIAAAVNFLAAGVVAAFGFFAGKRQTWAFIVGMIAVGLDTVLTGLFQQWLSLALHIWALISMFIGCRACLASNR